MGLHERGRSGVPVLPSTEDDQRRSGDVRIRKVPDSRDEYELYGYVNLGTTLTRIGLFTGRFPNHHEGIRAGNEAMANLQLSLRKPELRFHVQRISQEGIRVEPFRVYRGAIYRVVRVDRGKHGKVTLSEILRGPYRNDDEARVAARKLLNKKD